MRILIEKGARRLSLIENGQVLFAFSIALGRCPVGAKEKEGDLKTPEGSYYICTRNEKSRYHLAFGLSYPNPDDARRGLAGGLITETDYRAVLEAHASGKRPPWDTPLGGFIMIHGGGSASDWTAGCIALDDENMDVLWPLCPLGMRVDIVP